MTNPDNVGGLPELPASVSYIEIVPHDGGVSMEVPHGDYYTADQMRAYGELCRAEALQRVSENAANMLAMPIEPGTLELCRAAPAGGDAIAVKAHGYMQELEAAKALLREAFRTVGGEMAVKLHDDIDSFFAKKDSAPAGSGEVEELATRIDREVRAWESWREEDPDEYPITTVDLLTNAAALLRKLQQGADYVMVPRVPTEAMRAAFTAESMPGFAAMTTIRIGDFGERYRYMIAASQGQEGGENG